MVVSLSFALCSLSAFHPLSLFFVTGAGDGEGSGPFSSMAFFGFYKARGRPLFLWEETGERKSATLVSLGFPLLRTKKMVIKAWCAAGCVCWSPGSVFLSPSFSSVPLLISLFFLASPLFFFLKSSFFFFFRLPFQSLRSPFLFFLFSSLCFLYFVVHGFFSSPSLQPTPVFQSSYAYIEPSGLVTGGRLRVDHH